MNKKILSGHKIGVVFGTFAPLHRGHLRLIMQAKKECDGVIVLVTGRVSDRGGAKMPLKKRFRYVREFFEDDDLVSVCEINENEFDIPKYPNGWNEFLTRFWQIFDEVTKCYCKPVFYVGEEEYYEYLKNIDMNVVKVERNELPISATKIRKNPIKYWDYIAQPFKRVFSKNILIIGTASEGKTTLVQDLGKYFNTAYSHEYARDYMIENNLNDLELKKVDYLNLLTGQYQLNKQCINSSKNRGIFFADSDSMTTEMYIQSYGVDEESFLSMQDIKILIRTADLITQKCQWDMVYVLRPNGKFVDDNSRCMKYSDMKTREEMFSVLGNILKRYEYYTNIGNVKVLDKGYWGNFKTIAEDVKEMIGDVEMD